MRSYRLHRIIVVVLSGWLSCCVPGGGGPLSEQLNFDRDWYFLLSDKALSDLPGLDDNVWRLLDLPHDWSIEGPYSREHGTDWQSGFLPAGTGWYQKTFNWDPDWKGKQVFIYFEGIYLNSDVWINGVHLGHRPNGYISFEYELTPHLNQGRNVLSVRVDHSKPLTGRWYTGSGIYRHVFLEAKNPVYIPRWGVHFTTPGGPGSPGQYEVEVKVKNASAEKQDVDVLITLHGTGGEVVAESRGKLAPVTGSTGTLVLKGNVSQPALWSPSNPYLYELRTQLFLHGRLVDEEHMEVGIRHVDFNPDSGLVLNGSRLLLKGVCDHHTAGAVGAAVPDDLLRYRLALLKEMGCNAIRTAHNPFSPSFYELCDEMGFLVLNEFLDGWEVEKARDDYGHDFEQWWERDARDFILRDRNHPSVFLWSIGNEVKGATQVTQKKLIDLFHKLDPSRKVTQGGNSPSRKGKNEDLHAQLDVPGYNGFGEEAGVFEQHHAVHPEEVVLGTEIPHTYQTRGVYRTRTHWRVRDFPAVWEIRDGRAGSLGNLPARCFPLEDLSEEEIFPEEISTQYYQDGRWYPIENKAPWSRHLYYQSSYDNAIVRANVRKTWQRVSDLSYVAGQFRWGSFDYLGETNDWPSRCANFGVIDVAGIPKDHFFLYKSLWTEAPMVHMLPHWTHPGKEGTMIPVVVYTNCERAELFLNGISLGTKNYEGEQLVWQVPYEAGTIRVEASTDGRVVARQEYFTAGDPVSCRLVSDRATLSANGTDVACILVEIVDGQGNLCPDADHALRFEVTGPAEILGVDNGDPLDLSAYKTNKRKVFRGKAMLLIKSQRQPGEVEIRAEGWNLESGVLNIKVKE